jgi:ABC-2 type transport system permease protein
MAVSSTSASFAPARVASSGSSASAVWALARRAFRDARVRTISYAYLFAIYAYVQAVGYRHTYPTLAGRLAFAHSFSGNAAIRLFYGEPHDLLTVSGYCAWRVGGTLAILAAVFGLLAAVRAFRTEEEAGRMELVLAAVLGRRAVYFAALLAIAAGTLLLWLAELGGFIAGGLPVAGSAYLALATVSVVPVCVGVGAIVSQLAPTRRVALELGGALVGLLFVLRVIADTAAGAGWLRWATPLGWAEELRPFSDPQPLVLVLAVVTSALALTIAVRIAVRRDVGSGLVSVRDTAEPRLRLLRTPLGQALRSERGSVLVWLLSVGAFAFILGTISTSISSAGVSKRIEQQIAKLGSGSILTPAGYVSFVFIFFVLAVSLFCCAQIAAARREEGEERLETLLAQPVGRVRWLGGRIALAAGAAVAISLVAGVLTWAGVRSQGGAVAFARALEAGGNCLPIALLTLGVATLAYAIVPRASAGVAYGLVAAAFLWDLVGSLLGAPRWLVALTPFEHVGLVPAQPFRVAAAAIMAAAGLLAVLAALALFRRRDLLAQ